MKSLASRVGVLTLSLLLPLLTTFGYVSYSIGKSELNSALNFTLQTNVEAIASLTEIEEIGLYEVEFADQMMKRFSGMEHPDIFLVINDATGLPIDGSVFLDEIPQWILDAESRELRGIEFNGIPYRGMVLLSTASLNTEEVSETIPVRIFFGSTEKHLNSNLSSLRNKVIFILLTSVILASLLAGWSARRSMRPLRSFSRLFNKITPNSFGEIFDLDKLPTELQKPGKAFNRLTIRLQTAFEREKQFTADAAHKLRTPIGAMKVQIQAALRSERDPEIDAEMLKNLEAETERLHQLCEDFLLLHSQNTLQDDTMSYDDFVHGVQDTIGLLKPTIKSNNSHVRLDFEEGRESPPTIRCHDQAIKRIVTNLLSNALQYAGSGKEIRVHIRICLNTIELECADDGPGIHVSNRRKVFERFVRGERSRDTKTGGAGLGLSISRELARGLGGDLTLKDSTTGATFVLALPFSS